jgi:hypothetical protein
MENIRFSPHCNIRMNALFLRVGLQATHCKPRKCHHDIAAVMPLVQ